MSIDALMQASVAAAFLGDEFRFSRWITITMRDITQAIRACRLSRAARWRVFAYYIHRQNGVRSSRPMLAVAGSFRFMPSIPARRLVNARKPG